MKILAMLACLGLVLGFPTISGASFTKAGPPATYDTFQEFYHGGGGGP